MGVHPCPSGDPLGKKALSLLLSLVLCLGLLPGVSLAAEDDNTTGSTPTKAIQLGTGGLLSPSPKTTDEGTYYAPQSYVYFGVDGPNPIQWRVLDADKANNGDKSGIFLLSENALIQTAFNKEYHKAGEEYHKGEAPSDDDDHTGCIPANRYQGSDAQQWCSDFVIGDGYTVKPLSSVEQNAMLGVAKDDAVSGLFDLNWGTSSLTVEDKLFFLSVQELYDHVGTYETAPGMAVSSQDKWWLRTPRAEAAHSNRVGGVNWSGWPWSFEVTETSDDSTTDYKARPAFNLNKDAVLMISDFYTGSSKTKGDVGQLTDVGYANNETDVNTGARAWKLTLKDSSRKDFDAHVTAVSGNTLTVSYEDAKTGENEYLSALVQGSDGTVKYYGRILALDGETNRASGTASITLPEGFNLADDQLFVYSEQSNDGRMTDYASELRELKLPDYAISADVTELDFGSVPMGFTAVPAAETVTITNTGTKEITVNLPTSTDYVITAGDGFTNGNAELAPNAKASFTVQPKTGLTEGVYEETLTVTTDQTDVQCTIGLSFTRSNTQPTEYAQVTLKNEYLNPSLGFQLLLDSDYEKIDAEDVGSIAPDEYGYYEYKLPENADGTKGTTNVVGPEESVTILIPAGTYDHYLMAPLLRTTEGRDEALTTLRTNDDLFEAGKHYTITVLEKPENLGTYTTRKTVETILAIYTVSFDANGGSGSPPSMSTSTDGTLASLPTPTRSSYSFDGWYTEKSGGTKVTTDTEFKTDTTVYAHWTYTGGSGGGHSYTYYTLTFETNGGSTISGERFRSGTTVDLSKYTPTYEGHTFTGWYSDKVLTDKTTGIKLDGNKTVYAGWRVEQDPQTGADPFTDVSRSDWSYEDVMFVYEKGLMVGTGGTTFSPNGTVTRGMMATILWRMEGSPAPKDAPDFTDVASGKWYADAIAWTTENGIYQGYGNGAFKPDDPITREQLAAIFYRYADYKGYDMTVKGSLDKFKDKDMVSTWAQDAMQWAVGSDLMKGKSNNTLDPQGTATRAEIAAMLHRFVDACGAAQELSPGA